MSEFKLLKLLKIANLIMASSSVLICVAVVVAYILGEMPFAVVFSAHLSLFFLPVILKLSYVARLVAQHHLNLSVR